MHKDRLVLMLLLAAFALMGADCRLVAGDEDDQTKLPNRAAPANSLLRTYFDTMTTPAGMSVKDTRPSNKDDHIDYRIPEDKDLIKKEGPCQLEFAMGGATTVTDVRCRLRIVPPVGVLGSQCEIQCRIRAPGGTRSGWKGVDFATDDLIDPQAEVVFLNEFDGLTTDGTWVIELIDALDDGDGRCVVRNSTLRINLGEPTAAGAANETATLDIGSTAYTYIPELVGVRDKGDWGEFGLTERPLRAQFVFTAAAFRVRSFVLRFSVFINTGVSADEDLYALLVAPSGGWFSFRVTSTDELAAIDFDGPRLVTYEIAAISAGTLGESFFLRGEPSNGTWTLVLWDTNRDSNIMYLSKDAVDPGPVPVTNSPASLALAGVN